jgi:hypothetical protein
LCLNYAGDARCYATGKECLLGVRGRSASNYGDECLLHGKFDVWVTQNDNLLISDIGAPSDEPKQCLALGINITLAEEIAHRRSAQLGTSVLTTERRCLGCSRSFWMTEHGGRSGLAENGHSHLCPYCVGKAAHERVLEKLGSLRYWCG